MTIRLPVPRVARPLPPCDPFRHRAEFALLLSHLYHAEAAALEGFRLLTDPRYVEPSGLFDKAARRLIADEARHLDDVAAMLARLGVYEVPPPTPSERELWEGWRRGDLFALPYKANVASLFCLFSEGMGYAMLHHLHAATLDPDIKRRLGANLEDEQAHLRLSITVLERALRRDPEFAVDFVVNLAGYGLLARRPLREVRPLVESLGFDFDVLVGSSLRFVFELLQIALERAGRRDLVWRVADRVTEVLRDRPEGVCALYLMMFLPEPPLVRRAVRWWGRRGVERRARRRALEGDAHAAVPARHEVAAAPAA